MLISFIQELMQNMYISATIVTTTIINAINHLFRLLVCTTFYLKFLLSFGYSLHEDDEDDDEVGYHIV